MALPTSSFKGKRVNVYIPPHFSMFNTHDGYNTSQLSTIYIEEWAYYRRSTRTLRCPGAWYQSPPDAQRACQGQITHSDTSILMIACARAHCRLMYTACKQRRKHFPLHGTDKGFLTTEEINVPDEDSNTAAGEIAPAEQFGISTLTLINMPSWWLSKWWKTVFTIKATDTD